MSEPVVVFETVHGSQAYGLARAGSDVDLKGVIVGPRAWYHGFVGGPNQVELSKDHIRFEVRRFFELAAKASPTLIEMLWTDPSCHQEVHPAGEALLAHRDAFLSRRVEGSFARYAAAQLHRIETHRRWLLHPPEAPPDRAAFGLPPAKEALTPSERGAGDALVERGAALPAHLVDLLDREKRYKTAHQQFKQYEQWKRERNPQRAELERRFGYDTKHALHLVRLLRMAVEMTTTGRVIVARPDREELWSIRDGAWSYERLVEHADALLARVEAGPSVLPDAPDLGALDALCVSIVDRVLG